VLSLPGIPVEVFISTQDSFTLLTPTPPALPLPAMPCCAVLCCIMLRAQAHEVPVLQARVDAFLQAATAAHPDVAWVTGQPPDDEPMAGCLLIKLTAYTRDDSGSGGVLDSRELAAWQALVSVAVGLMDAGSKGVGDGGDEGGDGDGDEGVSGGVPRLCVVYLNSSLSTQLAISRRRTTSKLIRRSAKVGFQGRAAAAAVAMLGSMS